MNHPSSHARRTGPVEQLRDEFRRHLELFYSRLKLAPPYDSVEKALARLTEQLTSLSPEDLQHLIDDPVRRWAQFRSAFVESGLSQKHRGNIAGLARTRDTIDLPPEFDHLLDIFRAKPS